MSATGNKSCWTIWGVIGRADKGLIMTTARFTTEASREATRDGAPAIDLVDGEDFCELLKEIRLGVRVKMVEEVELAAPLLLENGFSVVAKTRRTLALRKIG